MVFSQSARAGRRRKIADYAVTHDTTETAAYFKVGPGIVRAACKEFGTVPLSGLKGSVGQRTIAILKRLLDGMPQVEIAKEMSISRQRVHAVAVEARAAGIQLPE